MGAIDGGRLLTATELAARLGVSGRTVRKYANRGLLDGSKTPGGHWRFEAAAAADLAMRTADVAALLRVDAATVRRWVRLGLLRGQRPVPGGDWRFEAAEVRALLAASS